MKFGGRGGAVLLAITLVVFAAGPAAVARADVTAQGCSARAVVVVEPGPGPVTICFDGSVSGIEALQLAGANPVTYGFAGQGAAVCQLFGVGNPADQSSCLVGPGSQYWAYYRAGPGAGGWTYARGGASATSVTDGSVEGWRYGTGGAPGFVSFCAVVGCGPPPTEAPPVTEAPPAVTPAPQTAAPGTAPTDNPAATVGGASASKTDGKADSKSDAKAKDDGGSSGSDSGKGADSTTSTTAKGKDSRTTAAERKRSDSVEVAAGGSGGGSNGGSPIGVLVAIVIVAVAVAAGLLVRRRRGGPAPG